MDKISFFEVKSLSFLDTKICGKARINKSVLWLRKMIWNSMELLNQDRSG